MKYKIDYNGDGTLGNFKGGVYVLGRRKNIIPFSLTLSISVIIFTVTFVLLGCLYYQPVIKLMQDIIAG